MALGETDDVRGDWYAVSTKLRHTVARRSFSAALSFEPEIADPYIPIGVKGDTKTGPINAAPAVGCTRSILACGSKFDQRCTGADGCTRVTVVLVIVGGPDVAIFIKSHISRTVELMAVAGIADR